MVFTIVMRERNTTNTNYMTDKIYTDKNGTEIAKGRIVKFNDQDGEMRRKYTNKFEKDASYEFTLVPVTRQGRISRINSKWVNIATIWGGKCTHKRIPLTELTECSEEFYDGWSKSESYRCM